MANVYTLSIFSENSPGVLQRITTLFTKRKINIESLTVSDTEQKAISRFTIVVEADDHIVQTVVKQIARIIEVRNVYAREDRDLIFKEIAFFRVNAVTAQERLQVEQEAARHRGSIAYVNHDHVIVEMSGTEQETRSLYYLLEPFGIREFVRSGRIAISRSPFQQTKNQLALPFEDPQPDQKTTF